MTLRIIIGRSPLLGLLLSGLLLSLAIGSARAEAVAPTAAAEVDFIAWQLGSKLSQAALVKSRGEGGDPVARLFEESQRLAHELELTQLPPLYENSGDKAEDGARAIDYLLNDAGLAIAAHLGARGAERGVALATLAIKSMLAALLYLPEESAINASLQRGIAIAGVRSRLPAALYEPLLEAMAQRQPADRVMQQLTTMHQAIARHLLNAVEDSEQ